jgi:hypothetical protein
VEKKAVADADRKLYLNLRAASFEPPPLASYGSSLQTDLCVSCPGF